MESAGSLFRLILLDSIKELSNNNKIQSKDYSAVVAGPFSAIVSSFLVCLL